MSKAKKTAENTEELPSSSKLPSQKFSIFSRGSQFGPQLKIGGQKNQFRPPAPRITQNKGGGGK